ncbi:MAG: hypothetical protein AB7F32_05855 [Victivallaceae bacterium]
MLIMCKKFPVDFLKAYSGKIDYTMKNATKILKKEKKEKKARSANPALRRTESQSSARKALVARSIASEAKRSAPPYAGGARTTLRERNKRRKSNANCDARLSEAGL